MVRFHGLCDGKIMVKKTIFFGFFAKILARSIKFVKIKN